MWTIGVQNVVLERCVRVSYYEQEMGVLRLLGKGSVEESKLILWCLLVLVYSSVIDEGKTSVGLCSVTSG